MAFLLIVAGPTTWAIDQLLPFPVFLPLLLVRVVAVVSLSPCNSLIRFFVALQLYLIPYSNLIEQRGGPSRLYTVRILFGWRIVA